MKTAFIAPGAALVLAACSTGSVGTLPAVHQAPAAANVLQLAVGTARIGTAGGGSFVGLNVVATYRQPNGSSATLQNTPTLSAPAGSGVFGGFDVFTGVLPSALHQFALSPNFNAYPAGFSPGFDELGDLVGVYGYGLSPQNLVDFSDHQAVFGSGTQFVSSGPGGGCDGPLDTIEQYPSASPVRPDQALLLPLAFAARGTPNLRCNQTLAAGNPVPGLQAFRYLGGPPAWPSPQGYGTPAGFAGYPVGFTDLATAPVAGTYSLDVAYPIATDASVYGHATASATLPQNPSVLGPIAPPTLLVRADGSVLVNLGIPPGVLETIVFVQADACRAGDPPRQYAAVTRGSGAQQVLLSAALGPPDASGKPSHTFCTAADDLTRGNTGSHGYSAVSVGFDYAAREASYPDSTAPAPPLTNGDGHSGSADITTSSVVTQQYSAPAP